MPTGKCLKAIHEVLCRDNGLAGLCTQNGWIDNDTLWFELEAWSSGSGSPDSTRRSLPPSGEGQVEGPTLVSVHFEEVITKGGGCIAKRQPCWGRVRIDWQAPDIRVQPV